MLKNINIKNYLLVLLIAVAISFILFQYKQAIYAQLDSWKLIPRPERFTELYFNNHTNLPKQISNGEKISFSFVIHNLEGKSWQYPYSVFFISQDGQITNIEEATVTLSDGEYKTIEETYTSALADNNGEIFVELQQPKQELHFSILNTIK
jgi:hypothetical protein